MMLLFMVLGCWLLLRMSGQTTATPINNQSLGSPRSFFLDCQESFDTYPSDTSTTHGPYIFSGSTMIGRYRLPKFDERDSCQTSVKMDPNHRTESSSWEEIKRKFTEMNSWCFLHLCYQHTDIVGRNGRIVLWLGPVLESPNANMTANATAVFGTS